VIFDASVLGRGYRVEVHGNDGGFRVVVDGEPLEVQLDRTPPGLCSLRIGTTRRNIGIEPCPGGYRVSVDGDCLTVELAEAARGSTAPVPHESAPARLTAPMPGRVVRVLSAVGADVVAGQGLVVIEAMKMENELRAPRAGRISELRVSEGQAVETGALLAVVA
jgi:acetyl/propionyl-CoA carboxylase alpha subunit